MTRRTCSSHRQIDQTLTSPGEAVDIRLAAAVSSGLGVRYERQISRFLSGYVRYTYAEATDRTAGPDARLATPDADRARAPSSV